MVAAIWRLTKIIRFNISVMCIAIVVLVCSCVTTYDTISNRDFARQYVPGGLQMHPEYYLYSPSSTEHRLYFRFYPKELAYTEGEDSVPRALASVFFRVTNSENSIEILDSLTATFPFKGKPRAQFTGFVPVKFPGDGHYFIEIFLTDRISEKQVTSVIETDIGKSGQSAAFMIMSLHGTPLFRPYISVKDSFRIRSDWYKDTSIRVSFFQPDTILPAPPDIPDESVLKSPASDTVYTLNRMDTSYFFSKKEGIWLFSGTDQLNGKTMLNVSIHFPYTKTPESLLEPLGYLCTPKEFKQLKSMHNPKVAVDSFWMNTTDDLDEARELIQMYYSRVQLANYYFSDYREGWQTDMGMIYVVCGPPGSVKKTIEGEIWNYGSDKNGAVEFYFYKDQHPLFGTVYRLHRSEKLSRFWFASVSTWCDGRIFSVNP